VHDTIDGETILVNLKNGNYYSFDQYGAIIWEIISTNGNLPELARQLSISRSLDINQVTAVITGFLDELISENILVTDNDVMEYDSEMDVIRIQGLLNDVDVPFDPPILHKYTDMQDMLLLDPIHDTGEKGWPSGLTDEEA
jgi:hypothetical protein